MVETSKNKTTIPQQVVNMKIRLILYENIPCWYEISWQEYPPALILAIHKEFIESKKDIDLENIPISKSLATDLHLQPFKGNFETNIGYGGVFRRIGTEEKNDFMRYATEIPQVKKTTRGKCKDCKGTGKCSWNDEGECLWCGGTGKDWYMDWSGVNAISASLTVLTTWLHYCEIDTSAAFPQLLIVDTITKNGMHGGSLGGDISIPMYDYLRSLGERVRFPKAIQAMITAHSKMVGGNEFYSSNFNAYAEKGHFIINCPGDACGLHPSDWYKHEGNGYEFSCHNVDSAIQQITLLAGLATLHDMVRDYYTRLEGSK